MNRLSVPMAPGLMRPVNVVASTQKGTNVIPRFIMNLTQ
jgi:hypothetical protein